MAVLESILPVVCRWMMFSTMELKPPDDSFAIVSVAGEGSEEGCETIFFFFGAVAFPSASAHKSRNQQSGKSTFFL
jgi:hypothetical protein